MELNWKHKTVFTGDNLYVMRGMNSGSVDLIYLDPPFNSNRAYAAPIGSEAAGAAFKDTWTLSDVDLVEHNRLKEESVGLYALMESAGQIHSKGMFSYLVMMAVRLLEMRRLLKDTGSIYLHCDDTATHYLKLLMDAVFGPGNFRNAVVWKRFNFHSDAKRFGKVSDTLLFYSKTGVYSFNQQRVPFSKKYIDSKFTHEDTDGRRFRLSGLDPPGGRGPVYEFHGVTKAWRLSEDKMHALERDGRIYLKSKIPQLKRYLDELDGQAVHDIWVDISPVNPMAKERVGYPTQKPVALLDRIIRASSNEGDMVLDPFAGCATACVASERLGRQWVGIDISEKAAELVQTRIRKEIGRGHEGEERQVIDMFRSFTPIHRTDILRRTDLGELPSYRTHKHRLYGKQEGRCGGCNLFLPYPNMTIDHIVPQSKGGPDHLENLQLLCGACNSLKGDRPQSYLKARLKEINRSY